MYVQTIAVFFIFSLFLLLLYPFKFSVVRFLCIFSSFFNIDRIPQKNQVVYSLIIFRNSNFKAKYLIAFYHFFTGTEGEKAVLTPQNKIYNNFGQECVAVGCSVDLFLFNNAYIDVATLSQVNYLFLTATRLAVLTSNLKE